ncbi:hypothetical protein HD806DRAFT_58197 [Xylariaceae sp. AK1471]|nr:hypothetical protein HD806DRAFT_58197 [Xylariaceae sp. AK1471]
MALLGWSLILASVLYIAIRRPPLIETLVALCRGSPRIQRPLSADDGAPNQGHSSAVSVRQDAPVRRVGVGADRHAVTTPLPPSIAINKPTETPAVTVASSSTPSPQTTPKATAATGPANGTIPSLSLSTEPPASAAAVARATSATTAPSALPTLSAPPTVLPAMSMPPPPRPPKLNDINKKNSSLLAAPSSSRLSPLPNRQQQAQYDRQPGTSTLAPPPTHSSKPTKPSRKVTLEPGHSPLDWARLANHPTADLRGLGPGTPYLRVTPSMLKRQTGRRGKDAWTVLGGRVYNITPYLPFHPGGEPELLRAAGRDGTILFGEIHSWVNYETMLSSSLIGLLVDETEAQSTSEMDAMD